MKYINFIRLYLSIISFPLIRNIIFNFYVKRYRQYYTHIDYLPIFNFAEIAKGNLNYFYKTKQNRKYPKALFRNILNELYFQFKDLNNEKLRDLLMISIYKSKNATAETTKEKFKYKNQYNTLKKKIEDEKAKEDGVFNLDEFTDYIEQTFKQPVGSLNVHTTSTAKAYNNFQKAKEINKKLSHVHN